MKIQLTNAKSQTRVQNESPKRNTFLKTCYVYRDVFFIIGICIMLAALVYMIVNLNKADSRITMWLFFMITGLLTTCLGIIFRTRKTRKKKKFPFAQ